jgi:hypothetical protein
MITRADASDLTKASNHGSRLVDLFGLIDSSIALGHQNNHISTILNVASR